MPQTTNKNTKQFVDIREIRDEVVILKSGSLRALIEVGSINFELKSQDEQSAIIQAFQNFINSVDFPIQIVVQSRKLDIRPYISSLDQQIETIDHELLKVQAIEYRRFVSGLTELANIMSKKFYIVVPFYLAESSTSKKGGIIQSIKALIRPSSVIQGLDESQFESYKSQVLQRVELIYEGLVGIGLTTKLLKHDELKNIFYSLYNG